jgi:hypothetical protein
MLAKLAIVFFCWGRPAQLRFLERVSSMLFYCNGTLNKNLLHQRTLLGNFLKMKQQTFVILNGTVKIMHIHLQY